MEHSHSSARLARIVVGVALAAIGLAAGAGWGQIALAVPPPPPPPVVAIPCPDPCVLAAGSESETIAVQPNQSIEVDLPPLPAGTTYDPYAFTTLTLMDQSYASAGYVAHFAGASDGWIGIGEVTACRSTVWHQWRVQIQGPTAGPAPTPASVPSSWPACRIDASSGAEVDELLLHPGQSVEADFPPPGTGQAYLTEFDPSSDAGTIAIGSQTTGSSGYAVTLLAEQDGNGWIDSDLLSQCVVAKRHMFNINIAGPPAASGVPSPPAPPPPAPVPPPCQVTSPIGGDTAPTTELDVAVGQMIQIDLPLPPAGHHYVAHSSDSELGFVGENYGATVYTATYQVLNNQGSSPPGEPPPPPGGNPDVGLDSFKIAETAGCKEEVDQGTGFLEFMIRASSSTGVAPPPAPPPAPIPAPCTITQADQDGAQFFVSPGQLVEVTLPLPPSYASYDPDYSSLDFAEQEALPIESESYGPDSYTVVFKALQETVVPAIRVAEPTGCNVYAPGYGSWWIAIYGTIPGGLGPAPSAPPPRPVPPAVGCPTPPPGCQYGQVPGAPDQPDGCPWGPSGPPTPPPPGPPPVGGPTPAPSAHPTVSPSSHPPTPPPPPTIHPSPSHAHPTPSPRPGHHPQHPHHHHPHHRHGHGRA